MRSRTPGRAKRAAPGPDRRRQGTGWTEGTGRRRGTGWTEGIRRRQGTGWTQGISRHPGSRDYREAGGRRDAIEGRDGGQVKGHR